MKRLIWLVFISMLVLSNFSLQAQEQDDSWFSEYYFLALHQYNIMPKSLLEADFQTTISREEFCEIIMLAEKKVVGVVPSELRNAFTDTSNDAVNAAAYLGYVSGYADGSFRPEQAISRQEIFKIIYGFMMKHEGQELDLGTDLILAPFQDKELLADWSLLPTAFVSYRRIVQGDREMKLNPRGNTTKAEGIVLMSRVVEYLLDEAPKSQVHPLYEVGFNMEKYAHVLGEKERYESAEEALLDMTKITVPTWTLLGNGEKKASTKTILVHRSISERVEQIFLEIFEGEEQFPIKDLGGFAWRSNVNSEHRLGLAIDINSDENYMIRGEEILAGSLWEPGINPYSIRPDGDVVKAFEKYGFAWGGNAWQSNQDYMHFSYFGN